MTNAEVNTRLHVSANEAPRPRDAEATRQALIAAGQQLFSREAYDQVGVRAIAAAAGVNQALLNRYFGSKAGLFRAVLDSLLRDLSWLGGERDDFGARVAAHLCAKDRAAIDPLLILFRSTAHPESAALVREVMDDAVVRPLAAWLGGARALERAAAIISLLLGVSVFRVMLAPDSAGGAGAGDYQALVARMLQSLVDGEGD